MTFHYFSQKAHGPEAAEPRTAALHVAELVARYPNLSEIELERLIERYRELSALDMALMISDAELASKLDQFYKDHGRRLRMAFRDYAIFVYIGVAGLLFAIWAGTRGVI